jgi:hypothetical protein
MRSDERQNIANAEADPGMEWTHLEKINSFGREEKIRGETGETE